MRILGLGYVYKGAARGFAIVAALALLQFLLGVYSVLSSVPPKLAHLHQVKEIVNDLDYRDSDYHCICNGFEPKQEGYTKRNKNLNEDFSKERF